MVRFSQKARDLHIYDLLRISRLADIDPRIIWALQSVRNGSLSYNRRRAASPDLGGFAKDLGYPASWGDLSLVPAYGTGATPIWRKLGVMSRDGIGGIPCELVHGGNGAGSSCRKNISIRGQRAWLAALLIYLPVLSFSSSPSRASSKIYLSRHTSFQSWSNDQETCYPSRD